ncbi:MAG: dihydropteroate synthase [Bacteroidia bacterium]|jgi:dihydropteroate synthase|nr:dihydropteroate synthase [Paludibacter sp.]NCB67360.1 dihydropteroate synthase [Bacteroidia bacterium]
MQIKINDRLADLSVPRVMGIVNVTPDSFYPASRYQKEKSIIHVVEKMIQDGVFILDLGAYSTRPGAEAVSAAEEIERLSYALEIIVKRFPDLPVSVDTYRAQVARHVVTEFGVGMINDVSGGTLDAEMFETIADLQVAYVLMHMRGTPQDMQTYTEYENITSEVLGFLQKRIAQLHLLGVNDVIADPGFGFAKTTEQNFRLLREMHYLKELNVPLLAGMSRKSMIYKTLGIEATEALNGTTALNMLALLNGAAILRVHDVKEAVETIKLFTQYLNA